MINIIFEASKQDRESTKSSLYNVVTRLPKIFNPILDSVSRKADKTPV